MIGRKEAATRTALNNLAYLEEKLGNEKAALALQEEVYALTLKVYGEEHPKTEKAKGRLAEYREKAGG